VERLDEVLPRLVAGETAQRKRRLGGVFMSELKLRPPKKQEQMLRLRATKNSVLAQDDNARQRLTAEKAGEVFRCAADDNQKQT
jgi:hypothetical protein